MIYRAWYGVNAIQLNTMNGWFMQRQSHISELNLEKLLKKRTCDSKSGARFDQFCYKTFVLSVARSRVSVARGIVSVARSTVSAVRMMCLLLGSTVSAVRVMCLLLRVLYLLLGVLYLLLG